MKFESQIKKLVIGLLLIVTIIPLIMYKASRASYKVSQSIPFVTGKIEYNAYDFNIISMYIKDDTCTENCKTGKDGTKYKELGTDERIPSEGYTINEENSYCKNGTEEFNNKNIYTNEQGEHIISGLKKGDKCYLYFDEEVSAATPIISGSTVVASTGGMFNTSDGTSTTGKLYSAEDDYGTSYYYRGAPTDNWVKFGTDTSGTPIWWRIIRFDGEGRIRMIYAGTGTSAPATTGTGTQIGTSMFNSSYNNNRFVGYWYGDNGVRNGYTAASTIYDSVNNWYRDNISKTTYNQYVDTNAGFCNDRIAYTNNTGPTSTVGGGTGSTTTYYAARIRLNPNEQTVSATSATVTPTFKCTDKDNDLFTFKGGTINGTTYPASNEGRKVLEYPVGLITADEVSYAGMVAFTQATTTNYLCTRQGYWTMSPCGAANATMLTVASGALGGTGVSSEFGVRPVIVLKSTVKLSGSGTTSSPYTVS